MCPWARLHAHQAIIRNRVMAFLLFSRGRMGSEETVTEVVEAEGHLIDSQLLSAMWDTVVRHDASFDVLEFRIGRTNDEPSYVSMRVTAKGAQVLSDLLEELVALGGRVARAEDAVVCGIQGVKIVPEFQARDRLGFAFMTNEISSERRVEVGVSRIAAMMRAARRAGERIAFVAGPVVVHTGGGAYFCDLIRKGYVDVMLAGNALAVHDVEQALYGTSLGVDMESGLAIEGGHRHHMRAINAIFRAGGLRPAVESGVLTSGVMYECIKRKVDYVLAGSIRDDGPLPDTVMNLVEAQDRYSAALQGVKLVLVLSTMLHGFGVGNMLPAWVRLVCVDINPAVVTKLADRGSSQTISIVTDVGLFLRQLASALQD